jgi:hypothetical protein
MHHVHLLRDPEREIGFVQPVRRSLLFGVGAMGVDVFVAGERYKMKFDRSVLPAIASSFPRT